MPASRPADTKDRQKWTAEQDAILISAVTKASSKSGDISWHHVANHLPGRTNKDCRKRWHYKFAYDFRKGPWSSEEDQRLRDAVKQYGTRWNKVSGEVGTRNGDQCWKRWNDSLDPNIDHSPWDANEDSVLLKAVETLGRNWSDIVNRHFPGRTALSAKNRFSLLHRRIENAQAGTNPQDEVEASPASSSSAPSTPSMMFEDNGFDSLGMDCGDNMFNMNYGQHAIGKPGVPDFDLDTMLGLASSQASPHLENANYPTPSSILTLPGHDQSQSPGISGYNFGELDYFGSLGGLDGVEASTDLHISADSSTKELVVRAKCRSDRTKTVMEGLTGLVNGMMMQGDVKDVNFSIT
ncbi:hypothetical protein DL762_002546 [Monosporascus cannonballus]|uniref:Uncharacterized protein n=1 Tax=Monosporascus cannonballus TaxID=155416 RepID=A0ABY0HD45_9PEZI|nr:hypothetical protein DL762_002546 [Monosporascus cannonballus]